VRKTKITTPKSLGPVLEHVPLQARQVHEMFLK
jgi:hypothetical protein